MEARKQHVVIELVDVKEIQPGEQNPDSASGMVAAFSSSATAVWNNDPKVGRSTP